MVIDWSHVCRGPNGRAWIRTVNPPLTRHPLAPILTPLGSTRQGALGLQPYSPLCSSATLRHAPRRVTPPSIVLGFPVFCLLKFLLGCKLLLSILSILSILLSKQNVQILLSKKFASYNNCLKNKYPLPLLWSTSGAIGLSSYLIPFTGGAPVGAFRFPLYRALHRPLPDR